MAEFQVFDLGRAYAQAEGIKESRLTQDVLRAKLAEAKKPQEISIEDAIGYARIAKGAAASVAQNPSDENVQRQYKMLQASGAINAGFSLDSFMALAPQERSAAAQRLVAEIDPFLSGADPQKPVSPGYGAAQSGINPITGKPDQFIVDDSGNMKWLNTEPLPNASGQERSPYFIPVPTAQGVGSFNARSGGYTPPSGTGGAGVLKTIDDPSVRAAVTGAERGATLDADRAQQIEKRLEDMATSGEVLDTAGDLVRAATGSYAGALADKFANVFGFSPSGDQAIGALKVLAARLQANVPRFEGAQSDKDTTTYAEAAGDLGNPTIPAAKKLSAIRIIRELDRKYAAQQASKSGGQQTRTVVRSGTVSSGPNKGKRIIEYSDGTREYADR